MVIIIVWKYYDRGRNAAPTIAAGMPLLQSRLEAAPTVGGWKPLLQCSVGIGDGDQRQAVRRCGNPAPGAVATLQYLVNPAGLLIAPADRGQRARDVADHVLQEGVRSHLEHDLVAVARNADPGDLTTGLDACSPLREMPRNRARPRVPWRPRA